MFEDARVQHLGIAQDVPNAVTSAFAAARPPEFGEQTDEVLAEFGFIADQLQAETGLNLG